MLLVAERRGGLVAVAASIALALIVLLAGASRAQATELVYWDNYGDDPDTVGFANLDGSGGGALALGSEQLIDPEGMAYDTVTNRLFATSDTEGSSSGKILAINLDGGGATSFTAPGAPLNEPEGIALDPATRTVYWLNTSTETIAWAKLDGSAGGTLDTTGATLSGACCRIAVDPVAGRVYWVNTTPNPNVISYAKTDNSGGGDLSYSGASVEPSNEGVVVDPAAGRLYYIDGNELGFANLNGSGGGAVSNAGGIFNGPWGLAFDPSIGRFYWGNENNGENERENAIGYLNLAGGGGAISVAAAPVDNPQDPIIIKSPAGGTEPGLARNPNAPAELTCSQGAWKADYAGSFVYQAPRSVSLQWTLDGAAVPGATAATYTATGPGSYACTETATNQAGSTSRATPPVTVNAAKIKLTTKKKAKADAGDLVTFKVKAVNQGDLSPKNAKLCVKLPKASKDDLKAPKCKKLGQLKALGKKTVKLKVKVKSAADVGADKLTFQVKGSAGKAAKSKIVVK